MIQLLLFTFTNPIILPARILASRIFHVIFTYTHFIMQYTKQQLDTLTLDIVSALVLLARVAIVVTMHNYKGVQSRSPLLNTTHCLFLLFKLCFDNIPIVRFNGVPAKLKVHSKDTISVRDIEIFKSHNKRNSANCVENMYKIAQSKNVHRLGVPNTILTQPRNIIVFSTNGEFFSIIAK